MDAGGGNGVRDLGSMRRAGVEGKTERVGCASKRSRRWRIVCGGTEERCLGHRLLHTVRIGGDDAGAIRLDQTEGTGS